MNASLQQAADLLHSLKKHPLRPDERVEYATTLAALLLQASQKEQTSKEKQLQSLLAAIMDHEQAKLFITELTDQCFRSDKPSRIADQLRYIIEKRGVPKELPFRASFELKAFSMFSRAFPSFLVPMAKQAIRKQVASVVVPGETKELLEYLGRRRQDGFQINLNYLGEAILGEEEAENRLKKYLDYLAHPEIDYISVKPSSIFSQINLVAWDETIERLAQRIRVLFRAARDTKIAARDGTLSSKFVNFDMEEYRDLALTVEVFKLVLSEPEFLHFSAGIVLQSYIPDSFQYQKELTEWALKRKARGGAPIKIRIVKGANLGMERVEASLRDWPQAPYMNKWEADANFKKMLSYGCIPEHAAAVHLGIASHNLFDIAYGLVLRAENSLEKEVIFEMLEGMAPHMGRAIKEAAGAMLLYSPAVEERDFRTAVAYLMRRLDENTASENFLHDLFGMTTANKAWNEQLERFRYACGEIDAISEEPRRTQKRGCECKTPLDEGEAFKNEADTDWSIRANRTWIYSFIERWHALRNLEIPLVINGKEIFDASKSQGFDPSRPGYPLYDYSLASPQHVDEAVRSAKEGWKASVEVRSHTLFAAAEELRKARGNLICAMIADTGKTPAEADAEVSEAVDFCEYYRRCAEELSFLQDISWKPRGAAAVLSPWNFPCSIAAGGIAAALASGNAVLFKPASESVLVGWEVAQAFWKAGVPKHVLQFITGEDETAGTALVQHPALDAAILTGATQTAQHLLKLNPSLYLCAETGGKNSIIVTEMADRDQAIKDIVHSAFGHSGQKCSACSLLILLEEVYDDANFKAHLKDAVASLAVGSAWNLSTRINPLIRPPEGPLLRGLTEQQLDEEWLLQPMPIRGNPHLWSPGIKYGVDTESYTYRHELFGPVLSVMKAKNLKHAIDLANGTPYGLTAGIHTLDQREVDYWTAHIHAGNLYVNRPITGAIVQRQPFGGTKQSCFGPGAKAGGPNYIAQFMLPEQKRLPDLEDPLPEALHALDEYVRGLELSPHSKELWNASAGSYSFFQNRYFNEEHDPSKILGQDNILRYVPKEPALVRVLQDDAELDVLRLCAAAIVAGSPLIVSSERTFPWEKKCPTMRFYHEEEERCLERILHNNINTVRFLTLPSDHFARRLAEAGCAHYHAPVIANGRIELLHYLREVALSIDYHRYGNFGERGLQLQSNDASPAGMCCGANRPCCSDGICDETG